MAPGRPSTPLLLLVIVVLLGSVNPVAASGPLPGDHLGNAPADEPLDAILVLTVPPSEVTAELEELGLRDLETFPFIHAVAATAPPTLHRRALQVPGVLGVYPVEQLEAHLAESRAAIRADEVPARTGLEGRNVTVAVVDSGIDADHPAFGDRVRAGVRFSDGGTTSTREDHDGHGTHIAGIVAGDGSESRQGRLRGVAASAGLVGLDISSDFNTRNAIRAFEWLHDHHEEHGIRVVTNSWGRQRDDAHYDPNDPVIRASNALVRDGLVVIFSAGNRGPDPSSLTVEAMNPNVLTVGATNDGGHVEPYSSRGPAVDAEGEPLPWTKPDVVAPGTRITSTRSQSGTELTSLVDDPESRYYITMNGTSMAAPHAAGVAALLLERDPGLTPLAVKAILTQTASDGGDPGPDHLYGHGLLDTAAAVDALVRSEDREVVVTRTRLVPYHAQGEILAAKGRVLAPGADGASGDPGTHRLDVPQNAVALDLTLRWGEETASLALALDDGRRTHGPFEAQDGHQRVHVSLEPQRSGTWTLEVRPSGTLDRTPYRLDGNLTVVERAVVERPSVDRASWGGALVGDGSYFEDRGGGGILRALDGPVPAPWEAPRGLLLASALLGTLVGVLRRLRPS